MKSCVPNEPNGKKEKALAKFVSNYPWKTWYIFLILLASAVVLSIIGSNKPPTEIQNDYWIYTIIASLVVNALATYIVLFLGLPHFQEYLKDMEAKKRAKEIYKFWNQKNSNITEYTIYYGGRLGTWRDDESRDREIHFSSLATIYSIQTLTDRLGFYAANRIKINHRCFPMPGQATEEDNNSHIVILGGYVSINPLQEFSKKANFTYTQDFSNLSKRIVKVGQKVYETRLTDNKVTQDYALLTIAVESQTKRCLYWFSGNYGFGTFGAILAATETSNSCNFQMPKPGEFIQYLVEINDISNEEMLDNHSSYLAKYPVTGTLPHNFSFSVLWT